MIKIRIEYKGEELYFATPFTGKPAEAVRAILRACRYRVDTKPVITIRRGLFRLSRSYRYIKEVEEIVRILEVIK